MVEGGQEDLTRGSYLQQAPDTTELSPEHRLLVQLSLDKVLTATGSPGTLFFSRLFELDPEVRSIFPADIDRVERNFIAALTNLVNGLDNPEVLLPQLESLGRQHHEWGVREEHYVSFRDALLWALERSIGATFTPEVREAWRGIYAWMQAAMLRGAPR